jgi:hypothetical protein
MPVWDNAYPAIRAADVFSAHPPLLGTRTTASQLAGRTTNHPGPLEFVALAPWVKMFGLGAGAALGVAFTNTVSICLVAWLAFRRAGHVGTVVSMTTLALLACSMGSSMLFDPWPPHVTLYPFALALVAAWSVADGDGPALPVLVVSASFILQTHLGYVVLAPGLVVASTAIFGWRLVRRRTTSTRPLHRWIVGAAVLGLACWSPPLYDQLSRPGGNLTTLMEAAFHNGATETLSLTEALRVFAGTVILPPWWLPPSFSSPAVNGYGRGVPLFLAVLALVVLVAILVIGATRTERRGNLGLATGLRLVLLLTPLVVVTLSNVPSPALLPTPPGYLRFVWVFAAFVATMFALLAIDELRALRPATGWLAAHRMALLALPAAVAVVAGALAVPTTDRAGTTGWAGASSRALAAQVIPALQGQGPVLFEMTPPMSLATWVGPGLLAELRDADIPIVVRDSSLLAQLGPQRAFRPGNARVMLTVVCDPKWRPASRTARLVASTGGTATPAEAREVAELKPGLHQALIRNGGVPIRDDMPATGVGGLVDLNVLVDQLEAVGDDPDAILDSTALHSLVTAVLYTPDGVKGVIDATRFPIDDLQRYVELRDRPALRSARVFLDQPPRR